MVSVMFLKQESITVLCYKDFNALFICCLTELSNTTHTFEQLVLPVALKIGCFFLSKKII